MASPPNADTRKANLVIIVSLFAAVLIYIVARVSLQSEDDRLRGFVYSAAAAVEQKNITKVSGFVADGYHDDRGHDKTGLLDLVSRVFHSQSHLKFNLRSLNIDHQPDHVRLDLAGTCRFKRRGDDTLYNDDLALSLDLVQEGASWKIRSIRHLDPEETVVFPRVI